MRSIAGFILLMLVGCGGESFEVAPFSPAAEDAAMTDVGDDAPLEATPEAAPETSAPAELRCGGGAFEIEWCDRATQVCCSTQTAVGSLKYACQSAASDCGGIVITCAQQSDCDGGTVCCYTATANRTSCVAADKCPSDAHVCNPNADTAPCPSGQSCTPFIGKGVPYGACR